MRQVPNKWVKTALLQSDPAVTRYIPEMKSFSAANVSSMLARYGRVVAKPQVGAGGHGLILIYRNNHKYIYHHYGRVRSFVSFAAMMNSINKVRKRRKYMLQQGIHLARINGRPIDYRVKIVKMPDKIWRITAMVGRLARKGLFVTNLCRGGTLLSAAEGLRRSLSPSLLRSKKREMRTITYVSTGILDLRYPGIGQLGFDYGIDRRGKIWILEVNTRPQ